MAVATTRGLRWSTIYENTIRTEMARGRAEIVSRQGLRCRICSKLLPFHSACIELSTWRKNIERTIDRGSLARTSGLAPYA